MRYRSENPSRRTSLGAVAAVGALALALAACGDDDGSSGFGDSDDVERDEFGVGLYNAGGDDDEDDGEGTTDGDGDRIMLPVSYEVGQSSSTTAEMTIGFDVDAGSVNQDVELIMEMRMSEEVTDVSADGVATVETSIDAIDLVDGPAEVSEADFGAEFDGVLGEVVVLEYSESGMQIGEPKLKSGGSLPDEFADYFDDAVGMGAFPSEPIGVGARWSSIDEIESEGITVEGETIYELVELTEDGYVIALTQDIPVDEDVDGVSLDGSFSATGEIRGNRSNPLQVEMTYEQAGSFDLSGDGQSGSMSSTVAVDLVSR